MHFMIRSFSLLRCFHRIYSKGVRNCGNIARIRNVGIIAHVDAGNIEISRPIKLTINIEF